MNVCPRPEFRYSIIACLVLASLVCLGVDPLRAAEPDRDSISAMQRVIDQQKADIEAQSLKLEQQKAQLESQQQNLESQQQALEDLESQLQSFIASQSTPENSQQTDDQKIVMGDHRATAEQSVADDQQVAASGNDTRPAAESSDEPGDKPTLLERIHLGRPSELLARSPQVLDSAPLDVPDDRGLFMHSADGDKMIRFYGSLRTLTVVEDRDNFHPYDLNIPQVPVGEENATDWNTSWTINTSQLGLEVDLRDYLSVKMEFDWKGTDDAFRIRHMYMRTDHWLLGKNWSTFNTLKFLPQSIDSHSNSAHAGSRPAQLKFMGTAKNWSYHVSLEDFQAKVDAPEGLTIESGNLIPNLAGRLDFDRPWGSFRIAGLATFNKIDGTERQQNEPGLGLLLGGLLKLNDKNLIKAHLVRADGNNSALADFAYSDFDMAYDATTGDVNNLSTIGGQIALEHKWDENFTSAFGVGFLDMDNEDYQQGDAFDHGYKALANVFFRPGDWLQGLVLAAEVEYATQTTKDGSDGETTRISILAYYDW